MRRLEFWPFAIPLTPDVPHAMNSIRSKLSVMMFLEFFIWGAWLPLIFSYLPSLGFVSWQTSMILNAFPIASLIGMFFSNEFADRHFSAQRFLAVSHLVGGLAMLALGWSRDFYSFFALMLIHCIFYVPTISITNAIAFANLKDPQREFGPVRLWGTIGWIAASWPFPFILADWAKIPELGTVGIADWLVTAMGTSKTGAALQEGVRWTFITAGLGSLALAAFSLVLPHTPPKPKQNEGQSFAWLESIKLLAVPFVLVLFVVTFLDAAVHQCYFIFTNDFLKSVGVAPNWVSPIMSIGQVAEIGTMAVLGACLKRLGWRNIMVIGILGHTLRFGLFALMPIKGLAIAVIMVHGVCYAFFFATVYIFVDEFLPKDARSSAQGLFNFMILGLGQIVANFLWPYVGEISQPVVVTAEVRDHVVVVHGTLKNLASPDGKFELAMSEVKEDQAAEAPTETHQVEVAKDGTFEAKFGAATPGATYKFSPLKVVKRQAIIGDENVEVELPPLQVPEKKGADEPKVSVSQYDFQKLFLIPSGTALLAALGLAIFFRPPAKAEEGGGGGAVATPH